MTKKPKRSTSTKKLKLVFAFPIIAISIIVASCSRENKGNENLNLSNLKPLQTDTLIIGQSNGLMSLLITTGYTCPNELTVDNKKIFPWKMPMDFSNVKKGDMFIYQDDQNPETRKLTVVNNIIKDYDAKANPIGHCR